MCTVFVFSSIFGRFSSVGKNIFLYSISNPSPIYNPFISLPHPPNKLPLLSIIFSNHNLTIDNATTPPPQRQKYYPTQNPQIQIILYFI